MPPRFWQQHDLTNDITQAVWQHITQNRTSGVPTFLPQLTSSTAERLVPVDEELAGFLAEAKLCLLPRSGVDVLRRPKGGLQASGWLNFVGLYQTSDKADQKQVRQGQHRCRCRFPLEPTRKRESGVKI